MINLQTLLSAFDEKGTLLKWLKKVETALANATLENVQVVVVDETHIKMKFVFADGTSVESPSITLPRGPQGEQGIQGPEGPQGVPGTVSLDSLIALLEGSNYISVNLNEQQSKVKIELDLTMLDDAPMEGSANLVKSGGVYSEINRVENETETALAGKLAATKNAVANVGGLVTPAAVLASNELVGVGVSGEQVRVQLGEGLTLSGSASPYTLSASGGGGGGNSGYFVSTGMIEGTVYLYNSNNERLIASSNSSYNNIVAIEVSDTSYSVYAKNGTAFYIISSTTSSVSSGIVTAKNENSGWAITPSNIPLKIIPLTNIENLALYMGN